MTSVPNCCSNKCRSSRCRSCDKEFEVENIGKYACEIFIYTKNLPIFTSARDKYVNSVNYKNVQDSILNSSVPVFEDWMLVSKFHGSILWMKVSERNGILHTEILGSEPEDIENRIKIGVVKISIPSMMKLFINNRLNGEKYSLCGANCQSLIKDVLKELGIDKEIRIINDIVDITLLKELEIERDTQMINDANVFDNKRESANNEREIKPEIWIYTTRLEDSASIPKDIDPKKKSLINKALVPVLKHWILVVKFQSTTFWMDANSYNGILLKHFLEMEPDEVEERLFLGSVNMSVNEMSNLYNKVYNKFHGSKYSLVGNNCQSWILYFLKELGMGENLTIINDVIKTTGKITGAVAGLYVLFRVVRFLVLKF